VTSTAPSERATSRAIALSFPLLQLIHALARSCITSVLSSRRTSGGGPGNLADLLAGRPRRGEDRNVDDAEFQAWLADELSSPPGVRWEGEVAEAGGWGGRVMNVGAWLTIGARRVDVHSRDLDVVEHRCAEEPADSTSNFSHSTWRASRPTYSWRSSPRTSCWPELYQDPDTPAARRNGEPSIARRCPASLSYAEEALTKRADPTDGPGNSSRALMGVTHARVACRERVLNEKGLVKRRAGSRGGSALECIRRRSTSRSHSCHS
jgi:hypothetical protein